MFVREKQIGPYRYVYLVESVREAGRTKQRISRTWAARSRSRPTAISTAWPVRPRGWRSAR
jgi:hypothetical protein